jgi:peptidoglycan-N-acetylglucosamine deacetylase
LQPAARTTGKDEVPITKLESKPTVCRIALTFDAEHPAWPAASNVEQAIVELLDRRRIRASFFLQGRWAQANPGVACSIVDGGHLVGNHSHYHGRMPFFTNRGIDEDVRSAEDAIWAATGVSPRPWFRCPFGAGSLRVIARLDALGYEHVAWDIDPRDWQPGRTADDIEASVVSGVLALGGDGVVLLHAWSPTTLRALPTLITRLEDVGGRFVTVDELRRPRAALSRLPQPARSLIRRALR